jgi:hypothetical protein
MLANPYEAYLQYSKLYASKAQLDPLVYIINWATFLVT